MVSLEVWIEDLRHRVGRGELAGRGPITLRDGSHLPDTEAARIMLADLAHLDTLLAERRQDLLADFQHLRKHLAS
jgi:hypothetical protein